MRKNLFYLQKNNKNKTHNARHRHLQEDENLNQKVIYFRTTKTSQKKNERKYCGGSETVGPEAVCLINDAEPDRGVKSEKKNKRKKESLVFEERSSSFAQAERMRVIYFSHLGGCCLKI